MMCKVSFIIPVYNCKPYLPGCMESIEKTGLTDYEILFIDDGSTDGSGALCEDISASRPYVHTYHQPNSGVSAARNAGLAKASGDYIVFLDADDSFDSLRMGEALRTLQDAPADLLIYGLSFDYYHKGLLYRREELRPPFAGLIERSAWMRQLDSLYATNALSPIWNKVYRRQFLIDHLLTLREDMFLYEDLEYSLRCLQHCHQILFYPEIVYHYRQSEDEGNAGRRLRRIPNLTEFIGEIEIALLELTESHSEAVEAVKGTRVSEEAEAAEGTGASEEAGTIEATGETAAEEAAAAAGVSAGEQVRNILLSLYLVLAREKINVSTFAEIRQVCEDFSAWFEEKGMEVPGDQEQYIELLRNKRVGCLIRKRQYTRLRHKIAVAVKALRAKGQGESGKRNWRKAERNAEKKPKQEIKCESNRKGVKAGKKA